jgi:hypothetical protein
MENKINYLFEQFENIDEEEFQSHILNYICILQSGYLEKTIQNLLKDYKTSTHCNNHECKNNIKNMREIQNAKWCSIRPTFLNIDVSIVTLLQELDNFDYIINSINNIVGTRHKIAHGETVTNLTLSILKSDFDNIKLFLDKLQEVFEIYN